MASSWKKKGPRPDYSDARALLPDYSTTILRLSECTQAEQDDLSLLRANPKELPDETFAAQLPHGRDVAVEPS